MDEEEYSNIPGQKNAVFGFDSALVFGPIGLLYSSAKVGCALIIPMAFLVMKSERNTLMPNPNKTFIYLSSHLICAVLA